MVLSINSTTPRADDAIAFDDTTYCNTLSATTPTGQCLINAPAGGIAQFKGLVQGTTEDKYVEITCHGIQPYYYQENW
jgi:hypothetical protein